MADLYDDLLVAGLGDWLHAADVAFHLRLAPNREEAAGQVGSVVRDLIAAELVVAGDVTAAGFVAWDGSADDVSRRISAAWAALEHDPQPGDVCWLSNTAKGDARARARLVDRGGPWQ
jgi:hypothetical protein